MLNINRAILLGLAAAVMLALSTLPAIAGQGSVSPDAAAKVAPQETGTIQPSEFFSEGAHVANGASLRNASEATIRLRGLPANATIEQAILYWDFTSLATPGFAQSHVLFNSVTPTVPSPLPPTIVPGVIVGSGADPCWFGGANFVYKGDVTLWVKGNGDYRVGLLKGATSSTNGADPWGPSAPTAGPLAEGATLVVIYESTLQSEGQVFVYDSGLSGTEFIDLAGLTYTLGGLPTPPGKGTSIFTEIGADGQVGRSLTEGITGKTTTLNAAVIAGPGGTNLDSDWDGLDGVPLNQLWDTHSHDVSGKLVASPDTVTIGGGGGDCLVSVANVITIR
jgi:hypothetical protein